MSQGADFNDEEKKQARIDGATLVKNSGRGQRKGDAILGNLMLDYKFTSKNSYTINRSKLNDFRVQAWKEQKDPVVVVIFTDGKQQELAICDWQYLKDLEDEVAEFRLRKYE